MPSAYPADNFHNENLGLFGQGRRLNATGASWRLRFIPAPRCLSATQIKSAVRIGQAQAGELLISLHDGEDPIYGVDAAHPVSRDRGCAQALGGVEIGDREALRGAGIDTVVCRAVATAAVIYAKKEITQVGDMRGLSWRVYNSGTQRIALRAFPVTIQAADLQQALSTGLIEGLPS